MVSSAIARTREQWSHASLLDLVGLGICIGAFSLAVMSAKVISGVPGHALAFWLPVLFVARWSRPKPGTAAITAVSGGMLMSAFPRFGLGTDIIGFITAVVVLEAVAFGRDGSLSPAVAVLGGIGCGLAKFASRWSIAAIGLPAKWVIAGVFSPTLALHVFFGVAGGLLAWLVLKGANRLRTRGE